MFQGGRYVAFFLSDPTGTPVLGERDTDILEYDIDRSGRSHTTPRDTHPTLSS